MLAGFRVNAERGDAIRADLHRKTARVLDHVAALGVATFNTSGLPIIELPLADAADMPEVARLLFDNGIYVTLAAYPLVPRSRRRLPRPGHRRQHRRGDRRTQRRADPARRA